MRKLTYEEDNGFDCTVLVSGKEGCCFLGSFNCSSEWHKKWRWKSGENSSISAEVLCMHWYEWWKPHTEIDWFYSFHELCRVAVIPRTAWHRHLWIWFKFFNMILLWIVSTVIPLLNRVCWQYIWIKIAANCNSQRLSLASWSINKAINGRYAYIST